MPFVNALPAAGTDHPSASPALIERASLIPRLLNLPTAPHWLTPAPHRAEHLPECMKTVAVMSN